MAPNFRPLVLAEIDEVRSAMQHQQMETYFQPKINLLRGDVMGVEALTRWHHPSGGVISPAVFMPTLESCGLLNELFFTQLNHGLELQRQAQSRGFWLNIAFNLEPVQLTNPDLVSTIKSVLGGYGLHGSSLTFELTESGLLEISATCLENLVRLRMMGCRLSIDDFGVGFSSLQRLCQLPFNEIKLDAEFVRGSAASRAAWRSSAAPWRWARPWGCRWSSRGSRNKSSTSSCSIWGALRGRATCSPNP